MLKAILTSGQPRPRGGYTEFASSVSLQMSTRVLVRPISLDMVGVGLDDSRCSTNATSGAFGPPQQSAGARGAVTPEALALLGYGQADKQRIPQAHGIPAEHNLIDLVLHGSTKVCI